VSARHLEANSGNLIEDETSLETNRSLKKSWERLPVKKRWERLPAAIYSVKVSNLVVLILIPET
jgi:hypothetical protein